ncbi:MAG: hypothetical protein IJ855_01595 [Bacteroidales bacterium]|nr:hypothetical protein [Bacteroidales bacterium]
MDKALLSGIFRDMVLRDGELILPFMGCIKLEDVPASFSEGGMVVSPPSKKLYFDNYNLSSNENLLNEYASRREVSRMAAKKALYADIEEIRSGAEKDGRFCLEGFGTFCFDKDEGYTIETDPDFMLNADTFGLSTLDLRDEKPEPVSEPEPVSKPEPVAVAETKEKKEEIEKTEKTETAGKKEKKEKAGKTEKKEEKKQKSSRTARVLLIMITVLAVLLILIMLVFIFKDALRPLLENILYTKEELEIINYKL